MKSSEKNGMSWLVNVRTRILIIRTPILSSHRQRAVPTAIMIPMTGSEHHFVRAVALEAAGEACPFCCLLEPIIDGKSI